MCKLKTADLEAFLIIKCYRWESIIISWNMPQLAWAWTEASVMLSFTS